MKSYFEVITANGDRDFMHDQSDSGNQVCDHLVMGDTFTEFKININDAVANTREFVFQPKNVGRIFARCVCEKTDSFVEELTGSPHEIYEHVECKELFYGRDDVDQEDIEALLAGDAYDGEFIFRLTQQDDGKWVLSLVFHDEEIPSLPVEWRDFVRGID